MVERTAQQKALMTTELYGMLLRPDSVLKLSSVAKSSRWRPCRGVRGLAGARQGELDADEEDGWMVEKSARRD